MIGSAPGRAALTTNLMVEAATRRTSATAIPSWRGKNDPFMVGSRDRQARSHSFTASRLQQPLRQTVAARAPRL